MTKKLFLIIFSFSLLFACPQSSQENNYKNGKKDGLWIERYPDRKVESETNYVNGIKEGAQKEYFQNGNIKATANFKNGEFYGWLKMYYSNGKINFQEYYNEEGKSDSLFQLWFKSGGLSQQGFNKNGKMNGEWFYFSEKGDTIKINTYKNDTLLSSIEK